MVSVNPSTLFNRKRVVEDQAVADLSYQNDQGLLKQFWRFREYARGELRSLIVGVLMRFGEFGSDLLAPWPMALVIDSMVKHRDPAGPLGWAARSLFGTSLLGLLVVAALATLLVTIASGAFDYLGDRVLNSAGERITNRIRSAVFAHMQRLPMSYHDRQSVGELTSRIATDTGRIEDGMVGLFATLIPGIISLTGYTIVLLMVNWRLGLIALVAAPLLFITASRYTKLTRKSSRRRRAAEGRLSGFVAESLQGIRTVQAFGRQDLHDQRFAASNDQVLSAGLRAVELRARFTPLMEVVAACGTATLLFVGGYGVINGWWSIAVLVVVAGYLRDMLKPMKNLSGLALTFTQGAASAERIAAIFDQKRPGTDDELDLPETTDGSIELHDVGLDYGRGPVLSDLNLRISPRERIALLGHNGAGKSTLLSLISGLYPPTSGQVLLNGVSLADAPDSWRRRQVAVVLQDTFLFSGTIADNIRYGRPDASNDEVEQAAKAALVTEFTDRLDDGLNTELADGGIGLSGGQRQRVGIARALLTDAPIVLLDEPTTGLDVNAEELVVQALHTLVEHRTVVMTTHRPALTRLATRVVHLSRGTVTDTPDAEALAAEPELESPVGGPAPAVNGTAVNGATGRNGRPVDGYPADGQPRVGPVHPPRQPVNGYAVNGRTSHGFAVNGSNGYAVNGASGPAGNRTDGYATNGYATNGQAVNGQRQLNGQPVNGREPNGQPVNGQPVNGQPVNGQPVNGQPTNGQPTNGQPTNGQSLYGPPAMGQSPGGQPINGQGRGGRPVNGQSLTGLPVNGQPVSGHAGGGNDTPGYPADGSGPRPPRPSHPRLPANSSAPRNLGPIGGGRPGGPGNPSGYRANGTPRRAPESVGPRRPNDPNWPGPDRQNGQYGDPGRRPGAPLGPRAEQPNWRPTEPGPRRPAEPTDRRPAPPDRRPQPNTELPRPAPPPPPVPPADAGGRRRIGKFTSNNGSAADLNVDRWGSIGWNSSTGTAPENQNDFNAASPEGPGAPRDRRRGGEMGDESSD